MWLISNFVPDLLRFASPLRCSGLAKASFLAFALGHTVAFEPACDKPRDPVRRNTVRLSMGHPLTMYGVLGEALRTTYQRGAPAIDLQLVPSTGSISNVEAIQRGDADIAIAQAHVVYFAAMGQLSPTQQVAYDRLRGVAVLPLTQLILVAGRRSGIRHVSDLIGRRVGVGELGASISVTLQMLLGQVGIKQDMFHAEAISSPDAVHRLAAGTLDACFLMGYSPLLDTALASGAHVVPLDGPSIDQLRREFPFLRPTYITMGEYAAAPVRTIGVDRVLIARSDFDEQLVYQFTSLFFDGLRDLAAVMGSLGSTDVELAPATPIPLHEGAARYYRTRELSR